tara:strand:- start:1177 stop:1710 length:534 start_codon:yes stop_codon:yes gene_type:complete
VALLIFLLCGSAVHGEYTYNISDEHVYDLKALGKPEQRYKWRMKPTIRVCADSGVSVSRAAHAARYWERLGYSFDGIYTSLPATCINPKFGEILISIPDGGFDNSHMAATRLYTDRKTSEIVKAKIFILPKNARKERVLEHELGHALGWQHYRQRYHIMHPMWAHGGYDSMGLRKDD